MGTLQLTPLGDRQLKLLDRDFDGLREYLARFPNSHYIPRTADSIVLAQWVGEGKDGRTVLSLFPSHTLVILGPPAPELDALLEAELVEEGAER
jgi:hypothetical protein